jgi:hypothetical protein
MVSLQMIEEMEEALIRHGHFILDNVVNLEDFLNTEVDGIALEKANPPSLNTSIFDSMVVEVDRMTLERGHASSAVPSITREEESTVLLGQLISRLDVTIDIAILEARAKAYQARQTGLQADSRMRGIVIRAILLVLLAPLLDLRRAYSLQLTFIVLGHHRHIHADAVIGTTGLVQKMLLGKDVVVSMEFHMGDRVDRLSFVDDGYEVSLGSDKLSYGLPEIKAMNDIHRDGKEWTGMDVVWTVRH